MYLAIDNLGILLSKIHQDLQLPPLFPLTEIIPLKYFFSRDIGFTFY